MKKYVAGGASLMVLLLSACGGEPAWQGTVRDSAGIAIVENTDQGIWTTSNQWTVQEEVRIGAIEGNPDYQFGQIGFMSVDSRGRIFVLDVQAQQVKVYSPEGRFEETIGRPGGGPGELTGAAFVVHSYGDTLFVPDLQTQRLNRFAPDGSVLESYPLMITDGLPAIFQGTTSGAVAMQLRPFALPNAPARDSMDTIALLGSDGAIVDTLHRYPPGETLSLGGATPEINLYSAEAAWAVTDDMKLLFGVNDDYRIQVRSGDGLIERIISKPFVRQPVSERDQEAIFGFLEEAWLDAGVPPAQIPQIKSIVHFGEFFPAFAGISGGPGKTVWIQRMQAASDLTEEELESYNLLEDCGAPEWDVFDPEGRLLGVVTMPPRFAPRLFLDTKIYGVWRDDLDVQYVVRLGIVGVELDDTGAIQLGAMP